MMEDGEEVQREERGGLKRKPTGPPRLLPGRTRTRSSGEDRPETKHMEISDETSARCSDVPAESKDLETHMGRHNNTGDSFKRRRRWWSRFSSAAVWIRKKKEARKGLKKPPKGAPQKPNNVSPRGIKGGEMVNKEKKFQMRRMLRRFMTSPDVQQTHSKRRVNKASQSFQKKLQKFFIRGGKRQPVFVGTMEVEEDQFVSEVIELQRNEADERLEAVMVPAEVNTQQMEDPASGEGSKPSAEASEDSTDAGDESEMIQTVEINQVLVQVESSEEDEVLCDSEVTADLHDQLPCDVPPQEKTSQTSQSSQPSINGPSIRIEVCPPEETTQEEEEDECWEDSSSSGNHLLLLLGFHHSERQLVQVARSLVRTALNAAVDQLTREQQTESGCR